MGTKERKQRLENEVTDRLGFKLGFGPDSPFPFLVLVPPIFFPLTTIFVQILECFARALSCTFYISGVIGGGHV